MINIYKKLLAVQKEIGSIKKDSKNPYFNSNYFDINALLSVVKPVLSNNGLVLTQGISSSFSSDVLEGGGTTHNLSLNTVITDVDNGEQVSYTCSIPQGSDPQKTGSAITYFRRYALQSLLALEAEDDDANVASSKVTKVVKKGIIDTDVPPFGKGSEEEGD